MKKIVEKLWWFIVFYLTVGYFFTELYRLRFLIIIFMLASVLLFLDLGKKLQVCGIVVFATFALFFFKIIPSPYPYFAERQVPMSISVLMTVIVIFVTVFMVGAISCHFFRDNNEKE